MKTSLPWVPADTKLSKLDTLRLAASYISHLRQILAEDQAFPTTAIHPLNLVNISFLTISYKTAPNILGFIFHALDYTVSSETWWWWVTKVPNFRGIQVSDDIKAGILL